MVRVFEFVLLCTIYTLLLHISYVQAYMSPSVTHRNMNMIKYNKIACQSSSGSSTGREHIIPLYMSITDKDTNDATDASKDTPTNPNIDLECIVNLRDISTALHDVQIKPYRFIRTGCVSSAADSPQDCNYIHNTVKMQSFIDLRSPDEVRKDDNIDASSVYEGYTDMMYNKNTKGYTQKEGKGELEEESKKRYFVSLMSESLIKKGVFNRFRKRNRLKALAYLGLSSLPSALKFPSKYNTKVRKMFLDYINNGGLKLLNELVVDKSGYEMVSVLKLLCDPTNLPAAIYCTAGKDRTGLIAMFVLHVLGGTDQEILVDYVHSDAAYSDIGDNSAVVVAMSQKDVNPDVFLRAKPEVMIHTLAYIRDKWGSIHTYLDSYGFDEGWRNKLRNAMIMN